jgi:hypothetical protein
MDDNQCRVCLGEASDSRYSVFKRVNSIGMIDRLEFVAGLKVSENYKINFLNLPKLLFRSLKTTTSVNLCVRNASTTPASLTL